MLIKPLITEKTLKEAANKNYTFVVEIKDNKTDIKKMVEKSFGVKVIGVKTMTMAGKSYRSGRRWIFRQRGDWKKAIVSIKKDQKIELFEVPAESNAAVSK